MLNKLKTFLLNTLFPPRCVSCKKEGDFLCMDCLERLDKKKISTVYRRTEKDPDFHHLDGVVYALDYAKNPQIKAAIKQMKYRFTRDMAEYFADLISEKIMELNMVKNKRIILIPVPLHKKRLNYRGFNQAEIIANAVASRFTSNQIGVLELLERTRHTDQQAKLDKYERRKNLGGAFQFTGSPICHSEPTRLSLGAGSVEESLLLPIYTKNYSRTRDSSPMYIGVGMTKCYSPNIIYFIVDDVCTTGSTLEECAVVLKENGFKKVYGLTIARAFK